VRTPFDPAAFLVSFLLACALPAQETRVFHYGENAYEMTLSASLLGVGFREYPEGAGKAFLARHISLLESLETPLPPHGVAVFRLREGMAMSQVLPILRKDPLVAFAHPVHHLGDPALEASRNILTNDFCIGLESSLDAAALAAEVGARVVKSFNTPGNHVFRLPAGDARDALSVCEELRLRPGVRFAHPDWLRYLGFRTTIPNDPLFSSQWHLRNTGQGGGTPGADVKAHLAWDTTTGDPNVIICIIDSGVERNHNDITQTPNGYNAICGAGVNNGDPSPGCGSGYAGNHGTSCAGVAAADINNNTGVAGIAGDCVIMPINLLGSGLGYGTPSLEAACFNYAVNNGADVISNSWGPDGVPWPLPSVVQSAFINATNNGRGGLGCAIFWAGGNGSELISTDGYASSTYTMAVGASTNFDDHAYYSDYGPELDFVAPSSGGTLAITTTSTNSGGASLTTNSFGGTSSAAPLAAGIAALCFSVDPNLTWTGVRDVLRNTAVQIDPSSTPGAPNYYDPTTGHSSWYGYGRLDANAAVNQVAANSNPNPMLGFQMVPLAQGRLLMSITGGLPASEFFMPMVLNPTAPLGSGPILGLPPEAFFVLNMPPDTPPFRNTANSNGSWSLFVGTPYVIPNGLVIHAATFEITTAGALRGTHDAIEAVIVW